MTDFTLVNLTDIEDSATRFRFAPAMEARFARDALGCERTGLSYQRLAPDAQGPFCHVHTEDEEIYVVLSGTGRAKLGDEIIDLKPLDALRVAPGTPRGFAAGPEGLELLAFGEHTEGDPKLLPDLWA
jgi:mannose-6-phosphate isomerase-like protein (cupin superfamily)